VLDRNFAGVIRQVVGCDVVNVMVYIFTTLHTALVVHAQLYLLCLSVNRCFILLRTKTINRDLEFSHIFAYVIFLYSLSLQYPLHSVLCQVSWCFVAVVSFLTWRWRVCIRSSPPLPPLPSLSPSPSLPPFPSPAAKRSPCIS
jgi:hypothetical protein